MSQVRFSHEVRIPAALEDVWSVLVTPSLQPVLEPRARLVSEWGEPGTVGSGYEVAMRGRPSMRGRVTDAVMGQRYVVTIEIDGRTRGRQDARLRSDGADCVLFYAVTNDVPRALHWIHRAVGQKQLSRWLDAVARLSTTTRGQQT
jgi:hypothetical protein